MNAKRLAGFFVFVGIAAAAFGLDVGQEGNRRRASKLSEVERLVGQLGSPIYRERQEAEGKLLQLEDEAVVALRKGRKSADLEVRQRATKILDTLNYKLENWSLPQMLGEMEREGLSRFVDRLIGEEGFAEKKGWADVRRLQTRVNGWASALSDQDFLMLDLVPSELATAKKCPEAGCRGSKMLLKGIDHPIKSIDHSVVISSRSLLHPIASIKDSVIIVSGEFNGCTLLQNSLILCQGKITMLGEVKDSIVITLDDIREIREICNSALQFKRLGRVTHNVRLAVFMHMEGLSSESLPRYQESFLSGRSDNSPATLFQVPRPDAEGGKSAKLEE